MNRTFKNDSSDYDDSEGDQQGEVHQERTQNKHSTVAIRRLVSKNKYRIKKDLTNDSDSVSYQSQRKEKHLNNKMNVFRKPPSFRYIKTVKLNQTKSLMIMAKCEQVFLNFLLIGQLLHFLGFYFTMYFNACRSFCGCCLMDNKLQHLHYFPYRRSRVTDQLFTRRQNRFKAYHKRKNQIVDNDNSQVDIKHQSKKLPSPKRQILISRPDSMPYHQLVTIGIAKDLRSQFHNANQTKRLTTYLKGMKNVQTHSRIILQCEYIFLGFFCVGSLISILYYGDRLIKSSTSTDWGIWYSSNHANLRENNKSHFINENVDHHHVDEEKYLLERKTTIFADNNISLQHPLITNSSIMPTISNNKTNVTADNSYKNHDFHQITYINWLKLINNVLWVLLLVIQIPMMIQLKKTVSFEGYTKSSSLSSKLCCLLTSSSCRLNEFPRILMCYLSYFLILVFTISQNILLVYSSTYDKHSNPGYIYSRKFSNHLNWLKSNLLYFPLLFQLTGSICFNLMQIIEILLKFTNVYAKDFDINSSFPNTSIVHNSLSTHAIHQSYMINQYRYVSHQELFLKYFILFTLCIEVIENCIEIICIPLIMVKCFLHRITKPTFFTNLIVNLITNEICLLLMKFFNPQLLSLEDNSTLNCSINYLNSHNMTNKITTNSIISPHDVTYEMLVQNTSTIVNSQTNFIHENKTVNEICNLVQFTKVTTNWWYWIFIKQLSYSICIIFRQSMLICCGFLYSS
uniref:Uncharacterized protein n=1 Tax=Schistosoma haematobium TaxID=6185 RepID=A0A094ZNW4_SCHHA